MTELRAEHLCHTIGNTALVDDVSLTLQPGELVALLGPNGAGKTSLIRACLGLQAPTSGSATLDGVSTRKLDPMNRARTVAYLPQARLLAWPNTVRDVVALGRYSHGVTLGRLSDTDAQAVDAALRACDLLAMAHRRTDTLSGGELARVHCARAFATGAPLLIADEPTAALDPRQQFRVMDLIAAFVAEGGGALVVLHDLSLAVRVATRLLWMRDGRILADGSPAQTLSAARLHEIYGVRARVNGLDVTLEGAS